MLEGTIRHFLDDRTVDLQPGTFVHVASGTWETYQNISNRPARILAIWTDPQIHKFFTEAFERAPVRELPPARPAPSPEQFAHLQRLAIKYGLEIKPPAF